MIDIKKAQEKINMTIKDRLAQGASGHALIRLFKINTEQMNIIRSLNDEITKHRNELIICPSQKIVRLVDLLDGEDNDYYWIYDDGTEIYQSTAVAIHTILKGYIEDKAYEKLVKDWNKKNKEKAV